MGLSKQAGQRLKDKVREGTKRNKGISLEEMLQQLRTKLQRWLNYFCHAKMGSKSEALDGWIRRRLKCFRLKQVQARDRNSEMVAQIRSSGNTNRNNEHARNYAFILACQKLLKYYKGKK